MNGHTVESVFARVVDVESKMGMMEEITHPIFGYRDEYKRMDAADAAHSLDSMAQLPLLIDANIHPRTHMF